MIIGRRISHDELVIGDEYLICENGEYTYPVSCTYEYDVKLGYIFKYILDDRVCNLYDEKFEIYTLINE